MSEREREIEIERERDRERERERERGGGGGLIRCLWITLSQNKLFAAQPRSPESVGGVYAAAYKRQG